MSKHKLAAVVLAAGQSKRFRGTSPKVLYPLCGRPMLVHVLETLREAHRSCRLDSVAALNVLGNVSNERSRTSVCAPTVASPRD